MGAYGGVALAELIGADVVRLSPAWDRRNGARAGALRGLVRSLCVRTSRFPQ